MNLPPNFVSTIDIVLYHKNCADGIGGAWPFWRENLGRQEKGEIVIEGITHGQLPPDVTGKIVVVVDYCFPRKVTLEMAKKAKTIVILDHHASAERDMTGKLPSNVHATFDSNRSGAQIAWEFVYPQYQCPWFIDVIADRDLWKWTKPYSKDVSNALYKGGYYSWEKFEWLLSCSQTPDDIDKIIKKFVGMSRRDVETEKEIVAACKKAIMTELTTPSGDKYRVKLANCASHKLRSEVGNRLSEGCDFAVTWQYDFFLDEWWCSARASADSPVDLSIIAAQFYRGGGHEKAAGFTIKNGENLKTYFKTIEIPANRLQDAKLLSLGLGKDEKD